MTGCDILRISREIVDIQKGTDLSIAVNCQEFDVRRVCTLIVGPPGTPYENGFFDFLFKFGPQYPLNPPTVQAKTTNGGNCRFNPNIYACGKVCLSILGTWPGETGEGWSPAQGLESTLLSIQSLMSNNPYENEPGFEGAISPSDKEASEAYCDKIRHETLRIAVILRLEGILSIPRDTFTYNTASLGSDEHSMAQVANTEYASAEHETNHSVVPFSDLIKRRFLWYYENYLHSIDGNATRFADGTPFPMMPFEHTANKMKGFYRYEELKKRLVRIKNVIDQETQGWAMEGVKEVEKESSLAHSLQAQFRQIDAYHKQNGMHNIDVSLYSDNPFVWIITYFGKSGTNLDGGIFRIRFALSPRFPDEQPRVTAETYMYHHRVSPSGTVCYFVQRSGEVKHHIDALIFALEEELPSYDPRTIVNSEASKLFWGDANDKKLYGRKQRSSAQNSVEESGL